ncbi:MAG: hypothetical protein WBO07_01525, partial [Formosimonas sp.]
VPDVRYGEELCAWVITKPGQALTEDELREFCKGQIAHYKVPRYIRFVTSFPMTVTGKIQKYLIRDLCVKFYRHLTWVSRRGIQHVWHVCNWLNALS